MKEDIIIELVKVDDIVPISKKPTLTVEMPATRRTEKDVWEIEFIAKGESAAGIEFYSWDFAYDEKRFRAEVMIDKSGTQKRTFKAGAHTVAVKVVDNNGLENIEVVKLKVNGDVKRSRGCEYINIVYVYMLYIHTLYSIKYSKNILLLNDQHCKFK